MQTLDRAGREVLPSQIDLRPRLGSTATFMALVAYLALVKLIILVVPATFRSVEQAAVFDWPFIAIVAVAGVAGLWFARKTGFPEAWDARVSPAQRFVIPGLLGLAVAVPSVAIDMLTRYSTIEALQHGQPRANIDFPASALIYPGGAIVVEVIYRMLPLPLLLWLISTVLLRGRGQTWVFWALALATSLIEPLTQDLNLGQFGAPVMVSVFLLDFALNMGQAALFRKYGFLAAIAMRVVFYVVWHMMYVH